MRTEFKLIIFFVASAALVRVSRPSLRSYRTHGFYRFFAWESIVILVLFNLNSWFRNFFSLRMIVAESCLALSLFLAIYGFSWLRSAGKPDEHRIDPTLFWIEKTTVLVTVGAYKYVRHPLITSLLFLISGVLLKEPSLTAGALAAAAVVCLIIAAKVEEKENLDFFGSAYAEYMKRTKMFIPFVI